MTRREKYLTEEDVELLRDACSFRYEQLNALAEDERIPRAARELIEDHAKELYATWGKLPDAGI